MVSRLEKAEALLALEENRRALGATDGDCVMCLLARGDARPEPIHENEDAVVLLDRFGARKGHVIIVVREHIEELTELGRSRYRRIQDLTYDTCEALKKTFEPTRLFVASLGAPQAVPMSFPHFHVHVIPLHESDERCRPARVFSWTDGVVVYDDEQASVVVSQIRAAWPGPHAQTAHLS